MSLPRVLFLLAIAMSGALALPAAEAAPDSNTPKEVFNFALLDHQGRMHELRRMDARAVVLFFTANECPIARQSVTKLRKLREAYATRGVAVLMVNSAPGDDRKSI